MLKIDSRLLDMTDPVATENFNRTLNAIAGAIVSIVLNADATGKITGGTATMTDDSTIDITVTTATK